MSNVYPSNYSYRYMVPEQSGYANPFFCPGEVVRVVYPEDVRSISKKYIEYDVLGEHKGYGTGGTRLYRACKILDLWGGIADRTFHTLRADEGSAGQKLSNAGKGSQVILFFLHGEESSPYIIGGVPHEKHDDFGRKAKGHHLEQIFNGVSWSIRDDGGMRFTINGKTSADGSAHPDRVEGAGAFVDIAANGAITLQAPGGQKVLIDEQGKKISVEGDSEVLVRGKKIEIGANGEKAVLGDTLVKMLDTILDTLSKSNVIANTGATSVLTTAPAFIAMRAQLQSMLSQSVTVQR